MKGNLRTLLVVALMSATILLPHEVASAAAAAPGNNVVNPITKVLSNGVGGIGCISEQEADAVLNPMSIKLSNGVGDIGSVSNQAADAIFNAARSGAAAGGSAGRAMPF